MFSIIGGIRNCITCARKRFPAKKESPSHLLAPKSLTSLPQCIKRMEGSAIAASSIWKNLEHMQANEGFPFGNYTLFLLTDQMFDKVVDK